MLIFDGHVSLWSGGSSVYQEHSPDGRTEQEVELWQHKSVWRRKVAVKLDLVIRHSYNTVRQREGKKMIQEFVNTMR